MKFATLICTTNALLKENFVKTDIFLVVSVSGVLLMEWMPPYSVMVVTFGFMTNVLTSMQQHTVDWLTVMKCGFVLTALQSYLRYFK